MHQHLPKIAQLDAVALTLLFLTLWIPPPSIAGAPEATPSQPPASTEKPACDWLKEVKRTNTWLERDQAPQAVIGKLYADASAAATKVDEEQAARIKAEMVSVSNTLVAELDDLVNRCGWPTTSGYGDKAPQYASLIVQHAPLEVQLRYFPLMEAAAQAHELSSRFPAQLEDRIRMHQHLPQRYGTQLVEMDEAGTKYTLYEVEDPAHLDERRSKVGMLPPSICAYIATIKMQVEYPPCNNDAAKN